MKRFFNWLSALFHRGMDKVEDPDMMLDHARREMQKTLTQNRERAVQAITQRNKLKILLEDTQTKSANLEKQAVVALQQGNRDLARQFMREKANTDSSLESLQMSLAQAEQTVESVKVAIRRQEEETRKKTAEALALKAQWKQAQIQNSITKALEGLTFEDQFETFNVAKDRVREMQSEASARQEMMSESVQGKIMQMQDQAVDFEAEEQLKELEQRLGLAPKPVVEEVATQAIGVGDAPDAALTAQAEAELDALEQRLKDSGSA
ncbi:MAG: PspA/IM30 family protein [Fimbriimonadaceae bacterium]